MPLLVGAALAFGVFAFARLTRMDRDRGFYSAVLITVATYYILFAAMTGSGTIIVAEALLAAVFIAAAALGFRGDYRLVAAALSAHGLFDAVHGRLVTNPSVPEWWPAFCMAYDVVAGLLLAWSLARSRREDAWLSRSGRPGEGRGPVSSHT